VNKTDRHVKITIVHFKYVGGNMMIREKGNIQDFHAARSLQRSS